ncbi:beta-propeller domain-containing protein [Candidatus Nitrosotenuis chungbukensis]|uniref:beta-propeller domain-containing protein n=1 Tax=Candidatus Nitrosotenuis chungbukensis TaxID=1353246 RepID=UPI002672F293|nr:beta-propeller domain-containing protein [Candidatus Nitrosotenuis chungbukensis]WKT57843.1 beta-propeller domain-containing protein [Candidatus Nitrosotenuis chungbukensis]
MNFKIISVMAALSVVGSLGLYFALSTLGTTDTPYAVPPTIFDTKPISLDDSQEIKKFSSYDEISKFLQDAQMTGIQQYTMREGGFQDGTVFPSPWNSGKNVATSDQFAPRPDIPMESPPSGYDAEMPTHSTTNVQVKDVDEPDYIKNDEKYAYIVSGDKLTIIDAYPAETAKIVLKVGLDIPQGQSLQNIFLNKNLLTIFYHGSQEMDYIQEYGFAPSKIYTPLTHITILDVSDKENPEIVKDYSVNGYYTSARMIGGVVYIVTVNDANIPRPIIPMVREQDTVLISPPIYYFDNPDQYYNFNTVTAIDIFNNKINAETFLMSSAGTVYVSNDNIYITYQKNTPYHYYQDMEKDRFFNAILPSLPQDIQEKIKAVISDVTIPQQEKWNRVSDLLQDAYNGLSSSDRSKMFQKIQDAIYDYDTKLQQQMLKTVVHKISISDISLKYVAKGEVPGRLLNQFSMDESGDRFRIATTSEYYNQYKTVQFNNVYVLDESLNQVGKLEKIAEDETIYSARFMDDRLYLVTFKRIDPFFVIDLSNDTPKVLGELKIPGYSNYLHPYDANHIIGIGKETKDNQYGGTEILGVKVALFDVTNVSNPKVIDVKTIGKQGADSEVLSDHKALLFDKEKNILSIPITEQGEMYTMDARYYETRVWRGFYVFGINPSDGITLKGMISHSNGTGYDYSMPSRSFYIGDTLYTVSSNLIKMNDLSDLHEINELKLRDTAKIVQYVK